jgi:hypothetical protein
MSVAVDILRWRRDEVAGAIGAAFFESQLYWNMLA